MRLPELCLIEGCLRVKEHTGGHDSRPTEAWSFFHDADRKKIDKAGYATPRGGDKGAYQNHVYRNNKVIVPFEHLDQVDLTQFADGYVVRLFPDQYFESAGQARPLFLESGSPVVGQDAFVLYRSHSSLEAFPPMPDWEVRWLSRDGQPVKQRSKHAMDTGEYVLRLSNVGATRPKHREGPPQGIFAPEYAPAQTNYECQAMLSWLIIHARSSPYTTSQAAHLKSILDHSGLLGHRLEHAGVTRNGLSICPLCLRVIDYHELHKSVDFSQVHGLLNAAMQVEGATRSTAVNLFHLEPLVYETRNHRPTSVAWGHATCNTLLGQRHCYSLAELQEAGRKIGFLDQDDELVTFGWISEDFKMIRSPHGAVWVQLSADMSTSEQTEAFDAEQDRQLAPPAIEEQEQ